MRKRVVKALKRLHAISVENPCLPGTPDVNYVEGWVELKCVEKWPKREDTILRLDHFTPQQKLFLRKRWAKGGNAFLLLQVEQDWLLFDGPTAAEVVGCSTKATLLEEARFSWHRPNLAEVLPPALIR